jgi:glyoxylase-like metal-dependent hydrolase (beta-lactamase superfamily II)
MAVKKTKKIAKKAPRKAPRRARGTGAAAKGAGLLIRMYRGGLGDCFLLRFPGANGGPFHMLIDCGLILGTSDVEAKIRRILADVIAVTGGRVDVLVATHEHWDHISGFVQARDLFADGAASEASARGKLRVETTWFAWTEDPATRSPRGSGKSAGTPKGPCGWPKPACTWPVSRPPGR